MVAGESYSLVKSLQSVTMIRYGQLCTYINALARIRAYCRVPLMFQSSWQQLLRVAQDTLLHLPEHLFILV